MVVGDLVMLSAYGTKRHYNLKITSRNPEELGLIIKIKENSQYPYKVEWMGDSNGCGHMRRELRYAYR